MRLRKALDFWYKRGVLDAQEGRPRDPFMIYSNPGRQHKDYRHIRRAYDAGWHTTMEGIRSRQGVNRNAFT